MLHPDVPEMNVTKLFNICWQRWGLVTSVAIIGTALTVLLLLIVLPRYTATATAVFHPAETENADTAFATRQANGESYNGVSV
jgi:uncharacterized protein involved in exopolysaccharide biosynthesis